MKNSIIKKGTLFLLSEGEYADYTVLIMCEALQDIDIVETLNEFSNKESLPLSDYQPYSSFNNRLKVFSGFESENFIEFLIKNKKICKAVRFTEWYLGHYGLSDFSLRENKGER